MKQWYTESGYHRLAVPLGVNEVVMPPEVEERSLALAGEMSGSRSEYMLTRQCIEMAPAWCPALWHELDLAVSLRGGRRGEEQDRGPVQIGPDAGG